jgi:hypothetical protein
MLVTILPNYADDDAAEARYRYRVMLVMALQLKVVLDVVWLRNLRAQSIEVLLHSEEVRYSCWLVAE